MAQVKNGDTVNIHYTGTFDDGDLFASSVGHDPLQFTLGDSNVIQGLDKAVIGMSPGESKNVIISSNEAYGPHQSNLLITVEKNLFTADQEPVVGQFWQILKDDGQKIDVKVAGISGEFVVLDANHPLAGKDLNFNIELIKIV